MITVDKNASFVEMEVVNRFNKTGVYFKIFGQTIHSEWYPEYTEGSPEWNMAVSDAKRRFASALSRSLAEQT